VGQVGGDQVWAYNDNKAAPVPPPNGWKVPIFFLGGRAERVFVLEGAPYFGEDFGAKGKTSDMW